MDAGERMQVRSPAYFTTAEFVPPLAGIATRAVTSNAVLLVAAARLRQQIERALARYASILQRRMIKLVDISKAFGEKEVLRGFTLDVVEGETMVIIGYSGTGKSVAIKHIVGLLLPDAGEVWVDGVEVPKLPRRDLYRLRARIGYVFQFAALFDSLSIGENVAMGLRQQGELSAREIAQRVEESLELVDLPNVAPRFPAELSGGMRKRVGIARAIALRPKYILYDEPTTGLDPVTSAVIDQLMLRMRAELGVTSVVITHDMRSAYRVGSRIAMLHEGRVRQVGTVEEIRQTSDPIVRQFIEGRASLHEDDAPLETVHARFG
jgi:phospholipid/cholesterol/gamma-HCH transport system ATP-binding protein